MIAHFDGTQMTTTGSLVDSWTNQGASGDAWASGSARPVAVPTVMPNGSTHTILDFDGVGTHLTMNPDPTNFDSNTITWIMLYKADTDQNGTNMLMNAYEYIYGTDTTNAYRAWGTFMNSGDTIWSTARDDYGGFQGKAVDASGTEYDGWHIISAKWNADGVGRIYTWLDGVYMGYDNGATADPSGHVRTRIGSNSGPTAGSFFDGQIAELRIYNTAIDDAERSAYEDYLIDKYFTAAYDPADLDQDLDVDVADLMKWQRDDGGAAGLSAWQSSFTGGPIAAGIASVPEPASASLLLLAALFACGGRRARG